MNRLEKYGKYGTFFFNDDIEFKCKNRTFSTEWTIIVFKEYGLFIQFLTNVNTYHHDAFAWVISVSLNWTGVALFAKFAHRLHEMKISPKRILQRSKLLSSNVLYFIYLLRSFHSFSTQVAIPLILGHLKGILYMNKCNKNTTTSLTHLESKWIFVSKQILSKKKETNVTSIPVLEHAYLCQSKTHSTLLQI